jgi:peroxiredoxin Q/BCP
MTVKVGEAAPDFSLQTDSGETVTLSQFRGSPVVLFFYPKADTHGCTKEACSFRDNYQAFLDAGAVLLGISTDSVESQAKFKSKHGLPFKLLVDKDSATRKAWGVPGSMMGLLPGRVTYLIDRQGVVRYIFDSQLNFSGHVTQTLEKIKEMQL